MSNFSFRASESVAIVPATVAHVGKLPLAVEAMTADSGARNHHCIGPQTTKPGVACSNQAGRAAPPCPFAQAPPSDAPAPPAATNRAIGPGQAVEVPSSGNWIRREVGIAGKAGFQLRQVAAISGTLGLGVEMATYWYADEGKTWRRARKGVA